MRKIALITGITGQDGAYLAKYLLENEWQVYGTYRRGSTFNSWRLEKLGILEDIINATPTDGVWDDGRTDENQMGLSYEQIEEAMKNKKSKFYKKYNKIRTMNLHKIKPIPVCKIKKNVR